MADHDPSSIEALLRGLGQGFTANFGDEGSAKILSVLPDSDETGIPKTYAAGSAENDYVQKLRRDNSASASAHPLSYIAGEATGALPAAVATAPLTGGGSVAGRVASSGLLGGALGAVSGAGAGTEGNRARSAAEGAGAGAALGLGGLALAEGLPAAANAAKGLYDFSPNLATAAGPSISRSQAISPGASGVEPAVSIPKAKPGFRPSQVPVADELATAADQVHGDKLLGRDLKAADVDKFTGLRDELKGKPKVDQTEKSAAKTVPPKRVRKKAEPVQTEFDLSPEPEPAHWMDSADLSNPLTTRDTSNRGVNDSKIATFETPAGPKKAIFKPTEGVDPTSKRFGNIEPESIPQREQAAYEIAKAVNPKRPPVPRTVARPEGSYQEFVDNAEGGFRSQADLDPNKAQYPTSHDMHITDLIDGQTDRHTDNTLWTKGRAHAIDNGLAFGESYPELNDHFPSPFQEGAPDQAYRQAPVVRKDNLQKISGKKIADSLNKADQIPYDRKVDTMARLRDLQYNPEAVANTPTAQLPEWLFKKPEARGLSDVDMYHIEKSLGKERAIGPKTSPKADVQEIPAVQMLLDLFK